MNTAGPKAAETKDACWSCGAALPVLDRFCPACKVVQEPRALDHFARLDLARRFDLDLSVLEKAYFALQRQFHPDRFAARTAREKALSLRHATAINEAYQVLKDPLGRAEHLLSVAGKPVQADGAQTVNDPGLLMEALEQREALAEADSAATVDAIIAEGRAAGAQLQQQIGAAFAANDLARAGQLALRLRYRQKLIEEARSRRLRMTG